MTKILLPPLATALDELCASAESSLMIVSPWLKDSTASVLLSYVKARDLKCKLLLRANLSDFLSESTDFSVLERLVAADIDVRAISNLHAKIYIADRKSAIVTSANLTPSGLYANVEIGVLVDDQLEVEALVAAVEGWFAQATPITLPWLQPMADELQLRAAANAKLKQDTKELYKVDPAIRSKRLTISESPRPKKATTASQPPRRKKAVAPEQPKIIVAPTEGPYRSVEIPQECQNEILTWRKVRYSPNLPHQFVKFFEQAFVWLPEEVYQQAYFGVQKTRISLVVGNLLLAGVYPTKYVWLAVDKEEWWDEFSWSTERYIPTGWRIREWDALDAENENVEVWQSYARGAANLMASRGSKHPAAKNRAAKGEKYWLPELLESGNTKQLESGR